MSDHADRAVSVRVLHGDCLDVLPTLGPVDAIVTDPPYHLGPQNTQTIGWPSWTDHYKDARAKAKAGFMGQQWDGGDIAFRAETWATIGGALKPSGYLLAFGGTRTWHRLACAIEDAGFVIQDTIAWVYGSGFPKNRTLLKPAFEPIVMAYKPGGKRELSIDECRVGSEPSPSAAMRAKGKAPSSCRPGEYGDGHAIQNRIRPENWLKENPGEQLGRWPANLVTDGSDEVLALFPQSKSAAAAFSKPMKRQDNQVYGKGLGSIGPENTYTDHGSAARFFYQAKAGTDDRWGSRHPTVKPVGLMKWLVQLVTPANGIVLDPFAGSGTTGVAALATGRNAILIERESNWFADIQERIAFYEGGGVHSVKAKNRNRKIDHGPLFSGATE